MLILVSPAVFLASSTWFTGTAAMPLLRVEWALSETAAAWQIISTQSDFIVGTFLFPILSLSDIFNPRRVIVGALTLGTAAPYLLESLSVGMSWRVPVAMRKLALPEQSDAEIKTPRPSKSNPAMIYLSALIVTRIKTCVTHGRLLLHRFIRPGKAHRQGRFGGRLSRATSR